MTHRIARLGHLGDGVTEDGVFVRRVLPGEVVEGDVVDGRIAKPRIVEPVAERIKPPCRHYNACGGCSLFHARDEFVAGWKIDQVKQALAGRGIDAPIRRIATSPPASRRRAVFTGRRGKSGPMIGFHAAGSASVTEVPGCLVLAPAMLEAAEALNPIVARLASRKGDLRLAVTLCETGPDVSINGAKPVDAAETQELASMAASAGLCRLSVNHELVAGIEPARVSFDGIAVDLPPDTFLQATQEGEAALRACVTEAVSGAARVLDLFAGCGTFALPLARDAEVHAVEGEAAMTAALQAGANRAKGLKAVTTATRDLFRRPLLDDDMKGFDALVIDPPRAGAEAQTEQIAKAGPPRVAMVSCNPVTFARDVAMLLAAGYRLHWIDVIDQFRWSPHIEIAASLTRDA